MRSIDRLSSLPDDLILNILSFLPTKTSVSTSILAKRWRVLWAHIPNFDFDSDNYRSVRCSDIVSFSLRRAQTINSFRLRFTDNTCDELDDWIEAIIALKVRKVDITLEYQLRSLPLPLFSCETLVDLRLSCCGKIPDEGRVYLPSLTRLHLHVVDYDSDQSLSYLLKGCPVLEELIVDRIVSDPDPKKVCFYVFSNTLKKLVIRSNWADKRRYVYSLSLWIPTLRYLLLEDSVSIDVSAHQLLSLTKANINLRNGARIGSDLASSSSVLSFIRSLSNVRCLKLSTLLLKVCRSAFSDTPIKFCNLTTLELTADWGFISYFLANADNLEVLTINMGCRGKKRWVKPCQVPPCLISRLKTVTIKGFWCSEIEFQVTKYILVNAKVLERMGIYDKRYHSKMVKRISKFGRGSMVKRISKFGRGSKACELVFH